VNGKSSRLHLALLTALTIVLATASIEAQPPYDVKANYDKQEVSIPMRDGVRLFTIIYSPKDDAGRYPILLARTAYGIGPYGPDDYRPVLRPNNAFAKEGYIFVYQDTRGKFKSEGEFIHHSPIIRGSERSNESTDTYDTIEWLLEHVPNHNGRVGQWGISWGGWEVSMGMIDAHPAIKASSPQAPPQDQFRGDDYHSNGAFQLAYAFNWLSTNARARTGPTEQDAQRFDFGTPDGYDFFLKLGAAGNARRYFGDAVPTWNDFMEHGTYDAYWQARNVPKDLDNISHPVLIVAGWFDAEDFYGPFRMYRAIEEKNPGNKSVLVVGPWPHGGWARTDGDSLGAIRFESMTGEYFRTRAELPFFNYYLKDKGELDLPEALVFETGGNQWHELDQWPPGDSTPRNLYLHADGRLSFSQPSADVGDAFDRYVSDPAKPVPYTAEITNREARLFVVEDQRFVSSRPDVLVYQSDVLEEDLAIAGPIDVTLFASTTGTDADWVVKLIDVFPGDYPDPDPNPCGVRMGGYQMLLAGDILRGKFRNSLSAPEPMAPNEVTQISFTLGDRYHTFLKGHRIMVHIQSSWFPMFDRNPQRFVDIYHARENDYQKAIQTVYRSATAGSHLTLPVVGPHPERP
jgi:putative CocE/NonD family hydrolase